jgi:hypothetical protein
MTIPAAYDDALAGTGRHAVPHYRLRTDDLDGGPCVMPRMDAAEPGLVSENECGTARRYGDGVVAR